jgi:hypothetical protein
LGDFASQFDENGFCKWCAARPGGEHAPDCGPPVFTVKDPAYIKNTDDYNEWAKKYRSLPDNEIDIRYAARVLEPAIEVFFQLGNMVELRRCILLQEYIHQTWALEQKLERRADYISTETTAIVEAAIEIRRQTDEKNDSGRGGTSD